MAGLIRGAGISSWSLSQEERDATVARLTDTLLSTSFHWQKARSSPTDEARPHFLIHHTHTSSTGYWRPSWACEGLGGAGVCHCPSCKHDHHWRTAARGRSSYLYPRGSEAGAGAAAGSGSSWCGAGGGTKCRWRGCGHRAVFTVHRPRVPHCRPRQGAAGTTVRTWRAVHQGTCAPMTLDMGLIFPTLIACASDATPRFPAPPLSAPGEVIH